MYEDPLQLFSEALAAVDREDWLGLAGMCDPVSLRVFRQQHLQGLEHDLRAPTADDYLRLDPDMSREVAEYQGRQAGR